MLQPFGANLKILRICTSTRFHQLCPFHWDGGFAGWLDFHKLSWISTNCIHVFFVLTDRPLWRKATNADWNLTLHVLQSKMVRCNTCESLNNYHFYILLLVLPARIGFGSLRSEWSNWNSTLHILQYEMVHCNTWNVNHFYIFLLVLSLVDIFAEPDPNAPCQDG